MFSVPSIERDCHGTPPPSIGLKLEVWHRLYTMARSRKSPSKFVAASKPKAKAAANAKAQMSVQPADPQQIREKLDYFKLLNAKYLRDFPGAEAFLIEELEPDEDGYPLQNPEIHAMYEEMRKELRQLGKFMVHFGPIPPDEENLADPAIDRLCAELACPQS